MNLCKHPPRVKMIASTNIDWIALADMMEDRGLEWTHDDHIATNNLAITGTGGALLAEYAGRGCYNSFGGNNGAGMGRKTNADYLSHILAVGHGSVLEHASFTFAIWGNSRGFTHELVRHRVGTAFSQASTRFRNESKQGRMVIPPLFRDDPHAIAILQKAADDAEAAYNNLRECARRLLKDVEISKTAKIKTARGAARCALPIGLESPITVTMNARTLRHFLEQRASPHAELEIREIAMAVYRLMVAAEPVLFSDYVVINVADGTEALTVGNRKV